MRYLAASGVICLFAVLAAQAQEFEWSWEEKGDTGIEQIEKPATPPPAPAETGGGIDVEGYNELVQENLELRRRIEEAAKEQEAARRRSRELEQEVRELEKRLTDAVARIDTLKQGRADAAGDPEEIRALETKLAGAEAEKARLEKQLAAAQKRLAPAAGTGVQPGSDLYREQQQKALELSARLDELERQKREAVQQREQMAEMIDDKEAAIRARMDKERELQRQLSEARAAEERYRETIAKLNQRVPAMEAELSRLKAADAAPAAGAGMRSPDMAVMEAELRERERRIELSERMAALMDRARGDVQRRAELQRRDLHYNMAAIYARDGRYEAAEREYLHALRIDPEDADSHYNLAILYDDHLNEPEKAAIHYRRYVKLRPHADDVDVVRSWLIRAEAAVAR